MRLPNFTIFLPRSILHKASSKHLPLPLCRLRPIRLTTSITTMGPLHDAVLQGYYKKTETLLKNGTDVNARFNNETALHSAADDGMTSIVSLLLSHGADINAEDDRGSTPLDKAVGKNRMEVVELLIKKGARLDHVNGSGGLLHTAVERGSLGMVKKLIECGVKVDSDEYEDTPLMLAVLNMDVDKVKVLLENGADVNRSAQGDFVLTGAVEQGDKETLRVLIEAGAKVDGGGVEGRGWLHEAVECGADITERLIEDGADVGKRDVNGVTALHLVQSEEDVDILVGKGAKVDAKDKEGRTPLHCAAGKVALGPVVEALIKHGADVNAKDKQGQSPLKTAKENDCTGIVEILTKHGGKENV